MDRAEAAEEGDRVDVALPLEMTGSRCTEATEQQQGAPVGSGMMTPRYHPVNVLLPEERRWEVTLKEEGGL